MMMKVAVLLLLLTVEHISAKCDVAPRYWCDSKEIAEDCGVLEPCSDLLWKSLLDAKPVSISLYYESLCPYCRQFITDQLYPTWKSLQKSGAMVVDMVAYGNAHETQVSSGYWNYTCQHGPEECTGNFIENCIQKYTDNVFDAYFPVIYCMESSKDPIAAAEKCVTSAMLDWNVISKCASGKEGNGLMHQAALNTDVLQPKHKYVPWILVNGQHTEGMQQEAQTNLLKVVCETYTGKKPAQCQSAAALACRRDILV
ncbi:gamma-interferon-inducible lysosomal thiol reductase-like [Clavelina lepadiformis]|uniref:gamma-interferon-inducible lysosomal thiol reductase-like n=1 Tax=Clavelina lepadiformis TaxID=159417 RepID=UPI00404178F8